MKPLPLVKVRTFVLALLCLATPLVKAITLDFSVHGLASFQPASQANNDTDVTNAANAIINWYNGGANPNTGPVTYTLSPGSGVPAPALPSPVTFGFKDEQTPFSSVNSTTYSYVLGKYGNTAYLFYIGNLAPGTHSLPATLGGHGLSHEVAFAATTTNVPDGGTTMALLGLSLLFVEGARRKLKLIC